MRTKNRMRVLRERKGWSQRDLARMVKTSQQQIQRFEKGASMRLGMACRIGQAFAAPLAVVFPELAHMTPTLRPAEHRAKSSASRYARQSQCCRLAYRLRSGVRGTLSVGRPDQDRLAETLFRDGYARFAIFNAHACQVALNLDHLIYARLSRDREDRVTSAPANGRRSSTVEVHLANERRPLVFEVSPGDRPALSAQFERADDPALVVSFQDTGGRRIYLRAADIALVRIPHTMRNPSPAQRATSRRRFRASESR